MSVQLPSLVPFDFTSLDFNSIINLVNTIISDHPDYFSNVDDFLQSNAAREVIELVAYVTDLLSDRIDWVANELTLPTSTQKQNLMNLLKLINYRLSLPKTAAVNATATIANWVVPFIIPVRYRIPGTDLSGNTIYFELLMKDSNGKYIYEGTDSNYQFNTGPSSTPILTHNDLVFYEGTSFQEFYTMQGINNETIQLSQLNVEEGSIRGYRITRDINGNIITRQELTFTTSFLSPEAQTASTNNLPPYELQNTESNGAILVFGETPVVAIFSSSGTDEVMIWYRTTEAADGNITVNSINYTTTLLVGGTNVQVSFLNTTAGSGGTDAESIDHAKRYGPLSLTTVEKTVNPDDFVILLQQLNMLLNAIAYGKSNEPADVFTDYGYFIPPFEAWIYPVVNQTGWEGFPTYSYPTSMKVGRPYSLYGYLASELISFDVNLKDLNLFKYYAHNGTYSNIKVTDFFNQTIYVPGADFVIDILGRTITRLTSGVIPNNGLVRVQYYEDQHMDSNYIQINFATSDSQPIVRAPVYPGVRSSAESFDLATALVENTLSAGDFNYPSGDYYIDYVHNMIIRNSSWPYLDGKTTVAGTRNITNDVNNEFILTLNGLNSQVYNQDLDVAIDCFNGWAVIGTGLLVPYDHATNYSFNMSVNGAPVREFYIVSPGTGTSWSPRDLGLLITTTALEVGTGLPFSTSGVIAFADAYTNSSTPKLTFMSIVSGLTSSVILSSGTTYNDLFTRLNLSILSDYSFGAGEDVDPFEIAFRIRCALNSMGLCNGFRGQSLPATNEEKPEIFSKTDFASPSTFSVGGGTNTLAIFLTGTAGGTFDGAHTLTLTNTEANSPYDLTTYQGRLDLISDMQSDIDNSMLSQGVVQVMWIRTTANDYRIGLRQFNVSTTVAPSIKMTGGTGQLLFRFDLNQSSNDGNLVEAKISSLSDMVANIFIRIQLYGAFGPSAFIQVKANSAVHNNTIDNILGMSDDQNKRGSAIEQRTLIAQRNLLEYQPGTFTYRIQDHTGGASENDRFNLTIAGSASPFADGDYVVTLPPAFYNLNQLIDAINLALTIAQTSNVATNISSFLICEKVEGDVRIRFRMTSFSSTVSPNVTININDNPTINQLCIDTLGFVVDQNMLSESTILLHYAGDWITTNDHSQATQIVNSLVNNRLISQDLIIKDTVFTTFDVVGTVYVAKGFDRSIIASTAETNVKAQFTIDKREFQTPVAITNITDIVGQVDGVEYLNISYFGKDYQKYYDYVNGSKAARITGIQPAENVVARWFPNSAFILQVDSSFVGGVDYDGTYLIVVGNSWTDRSYDSLVNAIFAAMQHAAPLELGGIPIDITPAVHVSHSSGVISFYTQIGSSHTLLALSSPIDIATKGYQTFSRTTDLLASEYQPAHDYHIRVNINGGGAVNYLITSPTSGTWKLSAIAAAIQASLPVTTLTGMDEAGKIRITSLNGGFASTIDITAGTATNLLTLIGPTDPASGGSTGYVNCLMPTSGNAFNLATGIPSDGAMYIEPATVYGLDDVPPSSNTDFFNYQTKIDAKYNEILVLSDDYFISGSTDISAQKHGLILTYVEA